MDDSGTTPGGLDGTPNAAARDRWRREQAAIDAAILEAMSNPENIAEGDRIMHEFRFADAETARAIDAEFGPWTEEV